MNIVEGDVLLTRTTSELTSPSTLSSLSARTSSLLSSSSRSVRQLVILTLGVFVLFSALRPAVFLSVLNIQLVGFALAEVVLLALAVTIAMLTGGIDLSVVSTANLSAFAGVGVMVHFHGSGISLIAGALVAILVAGLCGVINGVLIGYLNVPPILATLGTLQLFNGVAVGVRDGKPLSNLPDSFTRIGVAKPLGIPAPILALAVTAIVMGFLVNRSALGLRLRLLGDNATAARYSGLPNARLLVRTYVISAMLAALAGLIIASRNASVNADFGQSYLLLSIVVAILAGVNTEGGFATIGGVVLAGVCLQLVSSGLNSMNQSPFTYLILQGLIVIIVMALNVRRTS